jgi:hypothetical protein
VEVGVRVHLRNADTLDDIGNLTAPPPVEPGDLVATLKDVFRVEVVLVPTLESTCTAVLASRVEHLEQPACRRGR